ncbi:MAG TPA: hypothetical protein VKP03_03095, partial [Patescibacteria group bacterium]|nr:hypothetical protein [Patescibacteria group bacterium]
MKVSKEKLRKLLVDPGHIKEEHFEQAQKRASAQGQDLREALIEKQLIKDSQLGHLIAEDFGFDYVNLRREKIEKEVLHLIPELVAANKGVIAFDQMKDYVGVGMT